MINFIKPYTIFFLIFFGTINANGECIPSHYEDFISIYIERLSKSKIQSFVSNYKQDAIGKNVFLILELGNNNGILIEQDGCTVINLAKISYSTTHNKFVIEETHGGTYSYDRVDNLLQTLLKQKFVLLKSDELKRLLDLK